MSDHGLSEEAMLIGLRDIRLPTEAPGGLFAELLVALFLGLLLAVVLGLGLRLVTRLRPVPADSKMDWQAIQALPDEAQRLAMLRLLKSRAPERFAALTQALYQPDGLPDIGVLRAEVQRCD
ncbi:hypothetical protein [Puniceibacterium confluentis]|uniref:hypothetical protein n=1 Tax=Puniceibacterium confluentis TaxID=1958944 RepID=UPI0011B500FE|nr:hypothetical protein [Puniceibacterium confluentis]